MNAPDRRAASDGDVRFLRTLRVFADLPADDLGRILEQGIARRLTRGDVLFREDAPAECCYIVRSGRIQILKNLQGSQKHLGTRRSGELAGEIELLYGTPRMTDAVAAGDVELLELSKTTFDALIPDGRCRKAIFQAATDRLLQYENALAEADRRAAQEQLPALTTRWMPVRTGLLRRAYPFVAAETPSAAGAACLAMIDRFHRRESAWEAQLDHLLGDGHADTLVSLSRKLDDCGYLSRLVRVGAHEVVGLGLPAMVTGEHGSPAVLFHVDRRGALVADPRGSLRQITREEFDATWRGEVLTLSDLPAQPLRHLLREYAWPLASVAAASLLIAVFNLSGPLATKLVVDQLLVTGDTALLRVLAAGLGVVLGFRVLAGVLREHLLVHATRRAVLVLQVRLLDHLLRLPLAAAQQVGDVAGFRHAGRVVESAAGAGVPLIVDTLAVAMGTAAMFFLSPPLALIAVAFVAAYALVAFTFRPARLERAPADEPRPSAGGYLIELVTGIKTVKTLASEPHCTARGTRLMLRSKVRARETQQADGTRRAIGAALHLAAITALLGYGALLVLAGRASAGDVIASLGIAGSLIVPVEALLTAGRAARDLRESAASVMRVFGLAPEESTGRSAAPQLTGPVRLTEVAFRYPGAGEDALADVNLEILPGQRVALVGRSGSGKTTLVNLLAGMYVPTRGTIHVDGTDLAAIPKPALRRQLGIVEQHPFLFDGTVADNISRGDPSVTRQRIEEAARLAGAHDFIAAMPQGYDSLVGERGARLSGGERQRITIARAVVADPRLVILDEATSALDAQTEDGIYRSLQAALPGRTMIIIAHRLSTVRHADVIVVLDQGRIVETGSDIELMARRGLYYYLSTRTA